MDELQMLREYLTTALWAEGLDRHTPDDIGDDEQWLALRAVRWFVEELTTRHESVCDLSPDDCARVAHDMWCTRTGSGTGFLDGRWPDVPWVRDADRLARSMGPAHILEHDQLIGDEYTGEVHLEYWDYFADLLASGRKMDSPLAS